MTIAQVASQKASGLGDNLGAGVGVAVAYPGQVTAGNLLLIYGMKFSETVDPVVVGDLTKTAGTATLGTITLDETQNSNYSGTACEATAVFSVPVTGSGSCTMTLAGATAGAYLFVAVDEFSGVDTTGTRVDGINAGSGNTTAPDTGTVTSTAGALLAAAMANDAGVNEAITEDAAFTLEAESEDGATHAVGSAIFRIVTSSTGDSGSWGLAATRHWSASLAVYKAAADAAGWGALLDRSRNRLVGVL
jgi:hypothetical protein